MRVTRLWLAAALLGVLASGRAEAAIIAGGTSFDDNAFADTVIGSTGTWVVGPGATTLPDALVGNTLSDAAFCDAGICTVDIGFTNNAIVNGSGADFAVFALGTIESFHVEIAGVSIGVSADNTGETVSTGYSLLKAMIDLDSFGVAEGAIVNRLTLISNDLANPEDFTAVAAINNVPTPAALPLMLTALAAMALFRRRRGPSHDTE